MSTTNPIDTEQAATAGMTRRVFSTLVMTVAVVASGIPLASRADAAPVRAPERCQVLEVCVPTLPGKVDPGWPLRPPRPGCHRLAVLQLDAARPGATPACLRPPQPQSGSDPGPRLRRRQRSADLRLLRHQEARAASRHLLRRQERAAGTVPDLRAHDRPTDRAGRCVGPGGDPAHLAGDRSVHRRRERQHRLRRPRPVIAKPNGANDHIGVRPRCGRTLITQSVTPLEPTSSVLWTAIAAAAFTIAGALVFRREQF